MDGKKFIEKMKEFKKELESETDFSPREKEILFENVAKLHLSGESLPRKKEKEIKTSSSRSSENQTEFDSFTSLINKTKISQHNDYVLGAVYYLMVVEGYENVNVKNIIEEYKKAYLKQTNIGVYLVNLTKKGLLMSAGKKEGVGVFAITREGIKYMEEILKNGEQ